MLNLDEMLATKTIKQVVTMVKLRVDNSREAFDFIFDRDLQLEDYTKMVQKKLIKARKVEEKAEGWIEAASFSFSEELWNDIVINAGSCLEMHGKGSYE